MSNETSKVTKREKDSDSVKGCLYAIVSFFWYDTFDTLGIVGTILWIILLPIIVPLRLFFFILGLIF